MMELKKICKEKTTLSEEDIQILQEVAVQLPLIAELTAGDVFIDCPTPGGLAVVIAQAKPVSVKSSYQKRIVGEFATPEMEPAVFHALQKAVPIRDIKATTQEQQSFRQDVSPIYGSNGSCIAVLICEKDVRHKLLNEKKLDELSRVYANSDPTIRISHPIDSQEIAVREIHHRIKNNLQMVASILNLQSRQCSDPNAKKIFSENVARVLSIASIHDILTQNNDAFGEINSIVLLEKLKQNLQLFVPEGKEINICVIGDSVKIDVEKADAISLVVNELIVNALKYAFTSREQGMVCVSFCAGMMFHTITVEDDGIGFDVTKVQKGSLGLRLVDATVRDRLHGHLSIRSNEKGSKISFDFRI